MRSCCNFRLLSSVLRGKYERCLENYTRIPLQTSNWEGRCASKTCARVYSVKCRTKPTIYANNLSAVSHFVNLRWCGHECIKHQECWKCGRSIEPDAEQYFCKCGVVQPPVENRSYFQIFGMEEKFDIDLKELKDTFLKLQRILHPDRYSGKSEIEERYSRQHSTLVNKAYETLEGPLSRGLYLLRVSDEDLEKRVQVNTNFLSEVMDLNESISETKDLEKLREIRLQVARDVEDLTDKISKAFESDDAVAAEELLLKLKYILNASAAI